MTDPKIPVAAPTPVKPAPVQFKCRACGKTLDVDVEDLFYRAPSGQSVRANVPGGWGVLAASFVQQWGKPVVYPVDPAVDASHFSPGRYEVCSTACASDLLGAFAKKIA